VLRGPGIRRLISICDSSRRFTVTARKPTTPAQKGESTAPQDGKVARFFDAAKVSSVGLEMAVATGVGWGIGYWLDRKLSTGPYLMLTFLLLGVAAGFKGLLRAAKEVNRRHLESNHEL
jgi:ATP synthase protein I